MNKKKEAVSFLIKLLILLLVLGILFGVVYGLTPMKNEDMSPVIHAGDIMLYFRLEKNINNGDVLVISKEGKKYTGRVVARENDTVEITEEGELKVNGSLVMENNIYYKTPKYDDYVRYPLKLEDNQYFILGDYREGARDSRYFGAVNENEIDGKIITVIRRSNI